MTDYERLSNEINKKNFMIRLRQNYLSNLTFNTWNNLPEEAIAASSINEFKNRGYLLEHFDYVI